MTVVHQAPLSTISQSLLRFMSTELAMLSNHLIFRCLLLLLPSIFPSIRVFYYELVLQIKWPAYLIFSNSPSNEYSGLISFKIDWFYFLAVQGTLKSLLQHHGSKASIIRYIGKWILYHWATWETQVILCSITNHPQTL